MITLVVAVCCHGAMAARDAVASSSMTSMLVQNAATLSSTKLVRVSCAVGIPILGRMYSCQQRVIQMLSAAADRYFTQPISYAAMMS